ncbi:MAG TPA: hypothetical protein VFF29_05225 [Bacteroidota bacterium]|nr:hypothetical protein [Bacteroidota bacterium]
MNRTKIKSTSNSKFKTVISSILKYQVPGILIASISLYYTFFRVEEQFGARILSLNESTDTLVTRIAIFNSGNRQAMLTNINNAVVKLKNGNVTSYSYSGFLLTQPEMPLIVEPGEIVQITIRSPRNIGDWYANSTQCDSINETYNRDSRCIHIVILTEAVNSMGNRFGNWAVMAQIDIDEKSIKGVAVFDPLINLYDDKNPLLFR